MGWEAIEPAAKQGLKARVPVRIKVSSPTKGGSRARLFISIRPELLEGSLEFWTLGGAVNVMAGTGEDAGRLRIAPGRGFRIRAIGARGRQALSVVVPVPSFVLGEKQTAMACEFDYAPDWLEIEVPPELRRPPAPVSDADVFVNVRPVAPSRGNGFRTQATVPGAVRPLAGGR